MPCDTKLKRGQTITERKEEVKKAAERFAKGLTAGRVKAVVSKEGAIAFSGLTEAERDGVTDACAYRRIMASGSMTAKAAIARAEAMAGRSVDKKTVATGVHSHDGGRTWHHGH